MKFASPIPCCNHYKREVKQVPVFNVRTNPIRKDPSRTTMIRKNFEADIRRRFRKLANEVWLFLVEQDALGLSERISTVSSITKVFNASPKQYAFLSDPDKLTAFNRWFQQQVEADILSVPPGTPPGQPWTAKYVESAYKRGQLNAYFASKNNVFGQLSEQQFLRSSFLQPETVNKIRLLATRAFEGMKGISAQMGSRMNTILAQGLADGSGAIDLAKQMSSQINTMLNSRALVIARTEIMNAHAEGQLDAFEELGVDELGVMAEWSTAGDERVCPRCADMEGKLFTVEEARGLIPLHPNCRCSWIPAAPKLKKKRKR